MLWVAKAEADIAGARTLLAGDQNELAAFLIGSRAYDRSVPSAALRERQGPN
jgi:hypothetical protein